MIRISNGSAGASQPNAPDLICTAEKHVWEILQKTNPDFYQLSIRRLHYVLNKFTINLSPKKQGHHKQVSAL